VASSPSDDEPTDEYEAGWRLLQDHITSGQSWSGMERHCVFLNVGDAKFAEASGVSGLDFYDDGRGMAIVDWDHDGDLDVWISNRTGPRARLLRNDSSSQNSYISFRLKTATANPDAIGAEVELFFLGQNDERHVRTLRAGSGFISQSSKWVHFGVPSGEVVSHVRVRWPSGRETEHRDIAAGARWVLRQSVDTSELWRPERLKQSAGAQGEGAEGLSSASPPPLEPGGIQPAPPTSRARIPIIQPLPLLGLTIEDIDGIRTPLQSAPGTPVLLTLWADWCVNCKRELSLLQEQRAAIERAGLRVIAVSVDEPGDRAASEASLDKLGWEFERAFAHDELLELLAIAQRVLMERPQAGVIPTSYLIDGEGKLQVIYRGTVEAEQVLQDLSASALTPPERRDLFAEFEGWWSTEKIPTRYTMLAIQLRNRGYAELASQYLQRITLRSDMEDAPDYAINRIIASEINTGIQLMEAGNTASAEASFKRALALNPKNPIANRFAGVCLHRLGRPADARPLLELASEEDPGNAELFNDLGLTLIALDEREEAAAAFLRAIELAPELAKPRFNLGVHYAQEGRFDEAAAVIERATELREEYPQAWGALGRVYSLQGRYTDSARALERALELREGPPDLMHLYGQTLIELERREEARALLPKLRGLDSARAAALERALNN